MGVRLPKLFRVYDSEDYLETAIQAQLDCIEIVDEKPKS